MEMEMGEQTPRGRKAREYSPVFDVHVGAALDEFLHLLAVAAYRRALFH